MVLCVTLPPASMASLVTTRREGRTWWLVRSRVIVTSRFWELFRGTERKHTKFFFPHEPDFFGKPVNL
jgi:hypothetical protein